NSSSPRTVSSDASGSTAAFPQSSGRESRVSLRAVSYTFRQSPRAQGALLTEVARDLGLEEAKEAITARGRERGFVTSEDLLESVPVDDLTPEQVEEFLTQIEEHLRGEGIEVIEVPGDDLTDDLPVAAVRAAAVLQSP